MNDLHTIQQKIAALKPQLQQAYHVQRIGVFGSVVRGEQWQTSDVDILVEFNQPIGLDVFDLKRELEKTLGRKVDLATPAALKPRLKDKILDEVIYA